ncbi:MAG: hypothetical protein KGL95_00235 [Patescibacteria group bacterium]|nr:hypothetical protein [Patescibacteria group bacterium]
MTDEILDKNDEVDYNKIFNLKPDPVLSLNDLLLSDSQEFLNFSLLSPSLNDTPLSLELKNEPKIKGQPELTPVVLAAETVFDPASLPVLNFSSQKKPAAPMLPPESQIKLLAKYLLHL